MRLRVASGARLIKQQHLARFLGDRRAEVALDQVGSESRRSGAACAGDARAVSKEEPVGYNALVGKRFEEVLVVIPAHTGPSAAHEAGTAKDEAARADADQRHTGL